MPVEVSRASSFVAWGIRGQPCINAVFLLTRPAALFFFSEFIGHVVDDIRADLINNAFLHG
jgi:hypothetical protein